MYKINKNVFWKGTRKMKNKYIVAFIILILIIGGIAYFLYNKNSSNPNNSTSYNTSRTSINEGIDKTNEDTNNNSASEPDNTTLKNDSANTSTENTTPESSNSQDVQSDSQVKHQTETEIASFSTKIYTKDSSRQNNVSITCSKLNDTVVENGRTFSFCDTVGKATTSEGYQKADVFRDGEKIKALGGGNCQVSTTLYNAVLEIPELKVTERHAHSNSVPYIKEGKDAAVSYGSYDFKFVNNTGNSLKIKCSTDKKSVNVSLLKLE